MLTLTPSAAARTGFITVTGTVTTSQPIPQSTRVVFGITDGRPLAAGMFDESVEARAPAETQTVSLRVKSLRAGEAYSFYVGVDLNDDGIIGPGDLGGYYDGSTVLPFVDPGSARLLPVRRNVDDLDFGIGLIR